MQFDLTKRIEGFVQIHELSSDDLEFIKLNGLDNFEPSGDPLVASSNVITDVGDERIAELIGGISTNYVSKIAIGDEGVSPGDPNIPLAPTKADTVLGHELERKDITNVVVLTTPGYQLRFREVFFTDPVPPFSGPSVINEAGLFTDDGVMVARKTFIPLPFAILDRVSILLTWSLHVL